MTTKNARNTRTMRGQPETTTRAVVTTKAQWQQLRRRCRCKEDGRLRAISTTLSSAFKPELHDKPLRHKKRSKCGREGISSQLAPRDRRGFAENVSFTDDKLTEFLQSTPLYQHRLPRQRAPGTTRRQHCSGCRKL